MSSDVSTRRPEADIDLWDDEVVADPYPAWSTLRDLGPAVWLTRRDVWAIPRYESVKEVLSNTEVFSSEKGVGMNAHFNQIIGGTSVINSDGAKHDQFRSILRRPLSPKELRALAPSIQEEAHALVERLIGRQSFDAVEDLAQHLPVSIVAEQVGLPDDVTHRMLSWAVAAFNTLGPEDTPLVHSSAATVEESLAFAFDPEITTHLKPGGWAARIWDAAAAGEVDISMCPVMLSDYTTPSLDTTISATASLVWMFAQHPEQWDLLRSDPTLSVHALNEAIRLISPISYFTRIATQDYDLGGVPIREGERVLVMYGSANRDERKYPDPERFDISRKPGDHLAFGIGTHTCLGQPLARLEIQAILSALIPRVERFECETAEPLINNMLRGFVKMPVRVQAL